MEMTSSVVILASCWVLGGATVTQDGQLYSNIGTNDKIFTENIVFESAATSAIQCAVKCSQQDSCATFTFRQNTCRGHDIPLSSVSATQSAAGARSFSKKRKIKSVDRCEGTGVQRLTYASLGLNIDVYCDNGWLVFQKRQDGSVEFNRNWDNYTSGFGDVNGEYWLGGYNVGDVDGEHWMCGPSVVYAEYLTRLEPLHRITWTPVSYDLRVDLMSFNGTNASVVYSNFTVGPAADNYRLNYDSFLGGTTDDSLLPHRGMQFSTIDADHDTSDSNCAGYGGGGWWNWDCFFANLNGIYKPGRIWGWDVIFWNAFEGGYSLKLCQMMIRPVD